jgi:L-malate glycosyltransferase
MRILHIISGDTWAGAEAQALSLVRTLAARPSVDLQVVTLNDGVLCRGLRDAQVHVVTVDEARHGIPALIRATGRLIASFRPDVVHGHGLKENLVGGTAARVAGAKVVRTHHGKGLVGAAARYDVVERLNAAFLTDKLIAVSDDLRSVLVSHGLPGRKMVVVRNGVAALTPSPPAETRKRKAQLGIPPDAVVVGTTGRCVPVKNQSGFLEAARLVHQARPDAWFVIVGDGPLRPALQSQAAALQIAGNVVFCGFREDAPRLAEAFDVFALPSLHEGIPMALLEAMGLGTPVVATAVGGVPEVVKHRQNGVLVPPNDAAALARACLEVIEDAGLRTRLSAAAADDVRRLHSLTANAEKTYEVYETVLSA